MIRDLYIVNEANLASLLWRVLRGAPAEYLTVDPLLPPLRPVLERIVRRAEGRGLRRTIDRFPEDMDDWNFHNGILSRDPLALSESWQRRTYGFADATADARHGYAWKHVVTQFLTRRYMAAHVLDKAVRAAPNTRVHGLGRALAGLARAWRGSDALAEPRPMPALVWPLNLLSGLMGALAATAFVLIRIRPSVPRRDVFFLADHDRDRRDLALFSAMEDGGPVALVLRNRDTVAGCDPKALSYPHYLVQDGRFPPADALAVLAGIWRDAWGILRRYGRFESTLFWSAALLPYRRAVIRGLFNRCRPRYFWSRDDYNVEHVLRRQELHRIGARQLGLNHAVQGICILMPQMRYVSMDIYYTMGAAFHAHYRDSWAPDMELRATGAFAFDPAYFARPRRRKKAILFMARFAIGQPEFTRALRRTAETFPDWEVWLQMKTNYRSSAAQAAFADACRAGLPNVALRSEPVYDLILEPQFIVTDPSTIVAETIQLDIPTVVIDVIPGQRSCIFRQYPDLTAASAEACVARLQSLISGRAAFDRNLYGEIIALDEIPLYQMVRRDVGLPPPDQPR